MNKEELMQFIEGARGSPQRGGKIQKARGSLEEKKCRAKESNCWAKKGRQNKNHKKKKDNSERPRKLGRWRRNGNGPSNIKKIQQEKKRKAAEEKRQKKKTRPVAPNRVQTTTKERTKTKKEFHRSYLTKQTSGRWCRDGFRQTGLHIQRPRRKSVAIIPASTENHRRMTRLLTEEKRGTHLRGYPLFAIFFKVILSYTYNWKGGRFIWPVHLEKVHHALVCGDQAV